jgi:phospholipase/carboxylesterase
LKKELSLEDFYVVAPQATYNTWYPHGFLVPVEENEPWLSSAMSLLNQLVADIINEGISAGSIFLLGFSQGACLALEFASRYAKNWGGVIAFTGGLIGSRLVPDFYEGDLSGSEVFIGNSDIDPHVPRSRSEESKRIMEALGALVTLKIYPNMAHTINGDELNEANNILNRRSLGPR